MKDEKEMVAVTDSSFIAPPSSFPLNILVAEDNDFNAQLLEQLLVRRGHRVTLASDGRKALSLAEDGAFDLLLLDVHMPELDGFQVIQAIRERELRKDEGRRMKDEKEKSPASASSFILQPSSFHLPVIALTARSRKEDRERCLAAGMDDFLAKPIQADDLWMAIDRVLRKDEDGRMKGEKETISPSGSSFIIPHSSSGKCLLDASVLLAACGGDAVILEKICEAFRAGLPDQLTAVQHAFQERDTGRLRDAAHKLCGMIAAFSTVAGGVASDLEEHAAQGQLEEARPLVEQLQTIAQELLRVAHDLSIDTVRSQTTAAAGP
jgi:two-component system, sensor histidine kinase and response regulator